VIVVIATSTDKFTTNRSGRAECRRLPNIIAASVKAYLAALNKMFVATGQYTQKPEVSAVLN
jgi:hypothetical protein